MPLKRKAVLAGLVSLVLAGTAVAAPGAARLNVMNVSLPDGSVAHIHYRGDAPPRVVIAEAPTLRWFVPMSAYRVDRAPFATFRSEEHTSELQSLMRNSYAVFRLKKTK